MFTRFPLFRSVALAGWLLCLFTSGCSRPESDATLISWDELIRNLADPAQVADLDAPGATIITSHDRTGGNEDYNNPLGTDKDGWEILADVEGPGYMSRFWMTGVAEDHRIRMYFDGERTPRIDATIETLAGIGNVPPFLEPLCRFEQLCSLNQVPIPFEKRIRVTSQPREIKPNGWPRMFYQLETRALPEGQTINSFPTEVPADTLELLRSVARHWEEQTFSPPVPDAADLDHHLEIAAGESGEVALAHEAGIIEMLGLRLTVPDGTPALAREQILRELRLQAFWDGASQPSIDVPLGDFFGSPWYAAHFQSLYFGRQDGTYFCRFPMPFRTGARWVVINESTIPVRIDLAFQVRQDPPPGPELGYFHAAWNRTTPRELGQPHPVLKTTGRGAYAGCLLTVASQVNSWWILESDETLRMDGAATPQWQGTGLEDYFNGGWYYQFAQVRPTHGVLYKAPFRTIQFRTHPSDPVHFNSEMDIHFERGPDNQSPGWMESTAFYYLSEPGAAASSIPTPSERIAPESPARQHTLMTQVINLERLGDLAGAIDAIEAFLERFPATPPEMLRLRQLAYRERIEGMDAVREELSQIANTPEPAPVSQGAKDLLWFHEDPSHALLSVFCKNKTTAYLDGRAIVQAMAPQQVLTYRVKLGPGPHVIALEAETGSPPEWILAHLRTHHGSVPTMADWRFAYSPQGTWKKPGYDDSAWAPMKGNGAPGPPEIPIVYVEPHAHVLNVAEARGLRTRGPTRQDQGTFVFRKEFEIP